MTIEPDWKAMYDISNRRAYALEQALRRYMTAIHDDKPVHDWADIEAAAIKAIRGEE